MPFRFSGSGKFFKSGCIRLGVLMRVLNSISEFGYIVIVSNCTLTPARLYFPCATEKYALPSGYKKIG